MAPIRVANRLAQRTPCHWGRVEKRGGWKTSRTTPLPKMGFGRPPSYDTSATPLRCQCSVFPVQKSTTEQTRSSFGGVQKFSGERVLPPPIRFCTPPYHGPTGHLSSGMFIRTKPRNSEFSMRTLSGNFPDSLLKVLQTCSPLLGTFKSKAGKFCRRSRPRVSNVPATAKARSLRCGFWPPNSQILI